MTYVPTEKINVKISSKSAFCAPFGFKDCKFMTWSTVQTCSNFLEAQNVIFKW